MPGGLTHPTLKHHCVGGGDRRGHPITQACLDKGHRKQCPIHLTTHYPNEQCMNCHDAFLRNDSAEYKKQQEAKAAAAAVQAKIKAANSYGVPPPPKKKGTGPKNTFDMAKHLKKTLARK